MPRLDPACPAVLRAGCKINLCLFITGVRPDGWHELDSLFVPLAEPHDTLRLRPANGSGLAVACEEPGIDPENNTLTRAYDLFAVASGFAPGLEVRLEKGVPHGSGLGGGSADAAALLLWLNSAAPNPLQTEELKSLAVRVGADVPFFLLNAPCRALGVGDVLEPCRTGLEDWHVVLVCPPVRIATSWAYQAFDAQARAQTLTACGARNICRTSLGAGWPGVPLVNDFEPVVFAAHPDVRLCKEHLLRCGADGAVMSGSGAAVAGLFRSKKAAEAAQRFCAGRYGAVWAQALS